MSSRSTSFDNKWLSVSVVFSFSRAQRLNHQQKKEEAFAKSHTRKVFSGTLQWKKCRANMLISLMLAQEIIKQRKPRVFQHMRLTLALFLALSHKHSILHKKDTTYIEIKI
jgi:hypothetical protein